MTSVCAGEKGHEERAESVLEGEALDDHPQQTGPFPEIGAVIHKALKAAGLIRD